MTTPKESWWKRELKEIFAISFTFFVLFILFLGMKMALLAQYDIHPYFIGTAIIGSLILGKVVLIFDKLPLTKKFNIFPNIVRVFLRSFFYLFGYILFTLLEYWIKALIDGYAFGPAWKHAFKHLGSEDFLLSLVAVFILFLFFNAFWVVRVHYGPEELRKLFFEKK